MKKPTTASEIRRQITELEKQYEMMLSRERLGVIARMREAIGVYKVQPHELFPFLRKLPLVSPNGQAAATEAPAEAPRNKGTRPVRYRSPDGQTWSGYGHTPWWIKEHEENGGSRADWLAREPSALPPVPYDNGKPIENEQAVIDAIRQTLADGGMAKWRLLQDAHKAAVPPCSQQSVIRVLFRHLSPGPRGEHRPDALWVRTIKNHNCHFIELTQPDE